MLEVKEIPVGALNNHPEVTPPLLKHEFTLGLIAPKGAGKTTLLINMLNFYKGYFNKIIIFSPTIKNDEKWAYAKTLKLLTENKELKKIIAKVKRRDLTKSILNPNGKRAREEVPYDPPAFLHGEASEGKRQKFDGRIDPEFFISEYSSEDLQKIVAQQQEMVDWLESEGYSKHKADRILFIFDDLVGSALYSNAKKDPFKILNANHRHLSTSILMVSQAYKEIPKTIRTQFSGLILFRIANDQEKNVIYEEYSMGFDKSAWMAMYNECTEKKHSFMFIDTKADIGEQVLCRFSYIVGNKFKKTIKG